MEHVNVTGEGVWRRYNVINPDDVRKIIRVMYADREKYEGRGKDISSYLLSTNGFRGLKKPKKVAEVLTRRMLGEGVIKKRKMRAGDKSMREAVDSFMKEREQHKGSREELEKVLNLIRDITIPEAVAVEVELDS